MELNEYQRLAMRTATEEGTALTNVGLGLSGEAGECADLIKKHLHHGHPLDREKLMRELGDVMWYAALGCKVLGVTLEEVASQNIAKLQERYPDGFTSERSIHRPEYEREEQTESAPGLLFNMRNKTL